MLPSEVFSSDTSLPSFDGKLVPILPLLFYPRGAEFIIVVVLFKIGEDSSSSSANPKFIWKLSTGLAQMKVFLLSSLGGTIYVCVLMIPLLI
jgi:hypothetical protein